MSVTQLAPCPGSQLFFGSTVTNMSSITNNALRLMAPGEMKAKFGREFDNTKDIAMAMNGDGTATGAHVTGCTWVPNDGLYATFDRMVSSWIRINWLLFLAP